MKKKRSSTYFRFLLISTMMFVFFTPISADYDVDIIDTSETVIETTESNYYEDLASEKDFIEVQMMRRSGLVSIDDLIVVENEIINFDNFIYELKDNFNRDQLKNNYNFDDSQIDAILSYDASEEMRIQASPRMSQSVWVSYYGYIASDNKTYLTIQYTGTVTGTLPLQNRVNVTMTIGGSEAAYMHGSSSLNATYSQRGVSRSKVIAISDREISVGSGVTYSFAPTTNGPYDLYNLSSWSGSYQGVAGGKVTVSGIQGAWATRTFGANIGISVSGSGLSVSLSAKSGWSIKNRSTQTKYL